MAAPEEGREALITLEISSITELVSAQQRMRVLVISGVRLSSLQPNQNNVDDLQQHQNYTNGINEMSSSTLSFPIRLCAPDTADTDIIKRGKLQCTNTQQSTSTSFHRILNAFRRGKNKLVLREWKQGACWWNLNMNHGVHHQRSEYDVDSNDNCRLSLLRRGRYQTCEQNKKGITDNIRTQSAESTQTTLSMAQAEVAGYRLARLAMNCYQDVYPSNNANSSEPNRVYMPEVLYFSHDDNKATSKLNLSTQNDLTCCDNGQYNKPWALMSYYEYGGNDDEDDSIEIEVDTEFKTDFNLDSILRSEKHSPIYNNATRNCSTTNDRTRPCYHFPTTMIKIRHEFGFNEPHPRHGRVPIDECLDYSRMILNDVVLPIQTYFFMLDGNTENIDNHLTSIGWCNSNQETRPFQYHDMITLYRQALHQMSITIHSNHVKGTKIDERMKTLLNMVGKCISALECEWEEEYDGKPPPLPPVLCHMDLQPQNLAFGTTNDNITNNTLSTTHGNTTSKNDEEYNTKDCFVASVMDWEEACYADPRFELLLICRKVLANREQAEQLWQSYSTRIKQLDSSLSVGPLTPWLKLETVHSICTLLLQSMDLLGGGRSPWETKPDLWGKIDRERQRLVQLGWLFCEGI